MGGGAFLAVIVPILTLLAAAPLAAHGDGGPAFPAAEPADTYPRTSVDAAGSDRTRSADAPMPSAYTVVTPAQMSYRLLENKEVVFPPDYYPDFGPGLVLTDYPWGASSSFTPGLMSPYGTRLYVYNYSAGAFRRYSHNASFGGGFSWPGEITAVPGANATYLFTAGSFGGEGTSYTYTGQDISWPISNVIDFPRPTGMVPLGLLIPVTGMGFGVNEGIWIRRSWTRSGYDVIAQVSISRPYDSPPQKSFLYFVNLTNPEYLDVTRGHDVPPAMEIPWDAPIGCCYLERATANVLFNAGTRTVGNTYVLEYVFYDLTNQTARTFPAPSTSVRWQEQRGDLLYLLMDIYSSTRPSERTYSLVRVDLARGRDFGNLTADVVTEVWRKTFWQGITNYYATVLVHNDTLVALEGSYGSEPLWGPRIDSVTTFGLLNGTLLSQEALGLTGPTSRLWEITYPKSPVRAVLGSFVFDFDRSRAVSLNLTDIQTFIDQRLHRSPCASCYLQFFVTDYGPSRIRLFALRFVWATSRGSFTSVEINIGNPPPNNPPTARFRYTPTAYVGIPVRFNASDSEDIDGVIQTYGWDLGDGSSAAGQEIERMFSTTGPRTITLIVTGNGGLQGTASTTVAVHTLVTHDNPAGFRLPVPEDWGLQTSLPDADLLLDGPSYNDTASWVRVSSRADPSAAEEIAYLESVERAVVHDLKMEHPDAIIELNSSYPRIAGHRADVFVVRYDLGRVTEKIAIVVSADHGRWWALRFAIDNALYGSMDPLFDRMLTGFVITILTPADAFVTAIGILAACGFADLVLALLVALWPRRTLRPRSSPPSGHASAGTIFRCPNCNALSVPGARFCWQCGETFPPGPPTQ